jgi:hypothetical protein
MAKQSAKKKTARARESAKRPAAKRGRKTAAKKTGRAGGSQVSFGVHGMTRIVKAIGEAGLESEFNDAMGLEHQFVKVKRKSLRRIKDFVESKPELSGLAEAIRRCNCPDDDPYCFYI